MLFEIDHLTRYEYTAPVHLGEHLLRFLPPQLAGQHPGNCVLKVEPAPIRQESELDAWGNRIQRTVFQGRTRYLEIRAHLEVETVATARPVEHGGCRLAPAYGTETVVLTPYLDRWSSRKDCSRSCNR